MRRSIASFFSPVLLPVFLATSLGSVSVAHAQDEPQRPNGSDPSGQPGIGQPGVGVGGSVVVQPVPSPTGPSPYPPQGYPPPPTYVGPPGGQFVVPNSVQVHVRNDVPGIEHRLSSVDGAILGSCVGNCTFQVPPGTYYVESGETDTLRSGKKKIVVSGSTLVDVSPGSKSQRTTGLVMGITGPVLIFVGMIGLLVTAASDAVDDFCYDDSGSSSSCRREEPSYTPWVAALVGGIGFTTAGWIMFGVSGTKFKQSTYAGPMPYAPQPPPVAFAPISVRGGGGFGLKVTF